MRFLILTALAVISTAFLFLVPLQSIAKTYSKYLSYLIESDTKQKYKLKVKIPQFAKIIKNRVIRAGFCMSSVYFYRDKRMLQGILAMLGSSIVFIVLFTQADNILSGMDDEVVHSRTKSLIFFDVQFFRCRLREHVSCYCWQIFGTLESILDVSGYTAYSTP